MAKAVAVAEEQNQGMQVWKSQPAKLSGFLKDVRNELKKVVSPSPAEVRSTTIVVIVTVFVFAFYFWIVDNVIGRAIEVVLDKLTSH